ncbi:hypothetical protein [uncultured Enterococcus sp.]|uniref:hypothetical protein n=1 Tax=uncultured Enterococcus sp. TaxID=167972 RepID=UPI002AA7F745|nr:hypothetical protein [uncultured Enterococcus sp.]
MVNKFEELLEQLASGEIAELKVSNDEFFQFRDVWMKRQDRTNIVGEASHGGHVVYRYRKED